MQYCNKKYIEVLNKLIETNNSRIEGYSFAAQETEGATLKCLFSRLAETSITCNFELNEEIKRVGGIPDEGPLRVGKIFWLWYDVRADDTNTNRKTIFNSCELGEGIVQKAYVEALYKAENAISNNKDLIKKQYTLMLADKDKIKNLSRAFIKI